MMLNEGESFNELSHDILREEHQDGLEELISGSILILMSFFSLAQYFSIGGAFGDLMFLFIPCLLMVIWYQTKKHFTYPRMGLISAQFLFRNLNPVRKAISLFLLPLFSAIVILSSQNLLSFTFIALALYYLARFIVLGFGLKLIRFYLLAFIIPLGLLFSGVHYFIEINSVVQFAVPVSIGVIVIILGIITMRKFVLEWPKRKSSK